MKNPRWFEVDQEGLRELHSDLPLGRMVMELIQNVWDERSSICEVMMVQERAATIVVVRDDNPDGFKDLRDAYTLFRSTRKRSDPTVRGRFNYGDKIVLSRAREARIMSTTGTIVFGREGRRSTREKTDSGTVVSITLPRVSNSEVEAALVYLRRILPPANCRTTINGDVLVAPEEFCSRVCTLPTDILRDEGGFKRIARTARQTKITLTTSPDGKAMLFEMGLPVCDIAGSHDVNVHQKVPLSQDRTTVSAAYLRDVYAEVVNALEGKAPLAPLGISVLKDALESPRVQSGTAKHVFTEIHGAKALIQSNDADCDQEAARHGYEIVSGRSFGATVNHKLREAGVSTTHDIFNRKFSDEPWKRVAITPGSDLENFCAYVRMLSREIYGDNEFKVSIAEDLGPHGAQNENGHHLVFAVKAIEGGKNPVSKHTRIILHELAHCKGDGHDGVYDKEFERITQVAFMLALTRPEIFRPFEEILW